MPGQAAASALIQPMSADTPSPSCLYSPLAGILSGSPPFLPISLAFRRHGGYAGQGLLSWHPRVSRRLGGIIHASSIDRTLPSTRCRLQRYLWAWAGTLGCGAVRTADGACVQYVDGIIALQYFVDEGQVVSIRWSTRHDRDTTPKEAVASRQASGVRECKHELTKNGPRSGMFLN